jgi:hypothetical protein
MKPHSDCLINSVNFVLELSTRGLVFVLLPNSRLHSSRERCIRTDTYFRIINPGT